jgi:AcrR family transcriptional regulator
VTDHVEATGWDATLSAHRTSQEERIAQAALRLVADDGVAELTMSAVAAAAETSRQTLYKYYPDLGAVLAGAARLVRQGEQHLVDQVMAEPDAPAQLAAYVGAMIRTAASGHPSAARIEALLPPTLRAQLHEHGRVLEGALVDVLHRGVADGVFRADLDPTIDGAILYRAVLGLHDLAAATDDVDALVDHTTTMIHRMVASSP